MLLPSLLLLATVTASTATAAAGVSQPVTIGETRHIHSAQVNEDREYQVYLPDSYKWAKDRRYPVLYLLDGQTHFIHTVGSASYLAQREEIPELIIVAVTSTVRVRDFTQTDWPQVWIGGGGADKFKRFLSQELIPEIEKSYRTDGFRILSGHSASGQFALYCLTSEPALFQAYFAFSPSLDWDDNLPQRSLEQSFEKTARLPAYLYIAHSDDSGRPLEDYNRLVETLEKKSPQGFRWNSQPYPDETHGGVALLALIDALRKLYAGYHLHNDLLSKGYEFARQHFETVSKTVGWRLPIPESVINNLAYTQLSDGKTDEAIALFKRNVEANPWSANAYDSLAEGYAKAGQWKEAVAAEDKAVELAGEFDLPNRGAFVAQAKKLKEQMAKGAE